MMHNSVIHWQYWDARGCHHLHACRGTSNESAGTPVHDCLPGCCVSCHTHCTPRSHRKTPLTPHGSLKYCPKVCPCGYSKHLRSSNTVKYCPKVCPCRSTSTLSTSTLCLTAVPPRAGSCSQWPSWSRRSTKKSARFRGAYTCSTHATWESSPARLSCLRSLGARRCGSFPSGGSLSGRSQTRRLNPSGSSSMAASLRVRGYAPADLRNLLLETFY